MTSGRDLLRMAAAERTGRQRAGAAVVLANPAFDAPLAPSSAAAGSAQPGSGSLLRFDRLPGTADEAAALKEVLPAARVYTDEQATEALLKGLRGPEILHVATHGFFLESGVASAAEPSARGLLRVAAGRAEQLDPEDALALSGLALAGANPRTGGGGEDRILTALEAAGLDLLGTRLVVLSACETGLGGASRGDGVYGLRRALVLAGSESQVMSLWQVSDAATRDLMIAYYRRLRAGSGRGGALREVQLALLRGGGPTAHPFYWAGFIQSGNWRPAFD